MIYRTTHQAKRWVKWFLPFYLFTFLPLAALAQTLTGRAPAQVAVGEQFRLSYTVNTDDAKGFRAGDIPDAFDVLMLYLYPLGKKERYVYYSCCSCDGRR